ncbi:HEAT repeat domain-containing protein [Edaphobacter sp.]|uniref:HEAT repeat domain-containing protein n=1 Tax=Edaphobacter sp. TaxID=1934404 RepID=UPI002DB65EDB|nr:HEAT repeat domain-containing protein [Edaphobacter sp.]HEU5340912.1 HEAT repeat domain-containing protein [Edaphobacter sp.]
MRILANTVVLAALAVAPCMLAQQPEVLHAQLTTQPAGSLGKTIDTLKQQNAPLWIGYSIPVIGTFSSGWNNDPIAYLEGRNSSTYTSGTARPSFDHANILLRAEGGAITKLRVEAPDRQLDTGGLPFVWLTDANPDESVQMLAALATQADTHLHGAATFAIAIHKATSATQALIALAGANNSLSLRDKAAFWLVNRRGHDGLIAVEHLAQTDADAQFRRKLAFDLTLSKEPEALTALIRMAHEDTSPEVRRQAQFWMAHKGGKLVAGDLRDSAENDPSEQVRRSAVFALSRLPAPDATTQLIHLADTSKDPVVRKQAVFWLGQSHDPRALDYLTQLLKQ